jgi:hypothetical protein
MRRSPWEKPYGISVDIGRISFGVYKEQNWNGTNTGLLKFYWLLRGKDGFVLRDRDFSLRIGKNKFYSAK